MTRKVNTQGKIIVKGNAEGEALVLKEPLSFLGEVDINTGIITDGEGKGKSIVGKILVYPCSKGSSGAWRFLVGLAGEGNAPAAIINLEQPGYSETQGAILTNIPVMCKLEKNPFEIIETGDFVRVNAVEGFIIVEKQ